MLQFLFFLMPTSPLPYVPNFFFGALLVFIMLDLSVDWLWHARNKVRFRTDPGRRGRAGAAAGGTAGPRRGGGRVRGGLVGGQVDAVRGSPPGLVWGSWGRVGLVN